MRRTIVTALLVLAGMHVGDVRAGDRRSDGRVIQPHVAVAPVCWQEPRYFWSFTSGDVDYCRGHLKYEPGTLDCYYLADQVCSVFLSTTNQWSQTRNPLPAIVFPCPDAAKPPICDSRR